MNENKIKERYENEKPIFYAWGLFVQKTILEELSKNSDTTIFLKIPPGEPRIKSTDSFLAKAFHRNKHYESPYDDITDKVGIRFVVLLTEDTRKISEIITRFNGSLWRASKDRDFEEQRLQNPEHFTYESIHYVVFNSNEIKFNGVVIPKETPCEIQIRTLLQHAYAEMSHDTIYKSNVKADPLVKRFMARSMALVESADCFFSESMRQILQKSHQHEKWSELCLKYYPLQHVNNIDENANTFLIDQLIPLLKDINIDDVNNYFKLKSNVFKPIIESKQELSWIYRQPTVLLIYYLIENNNAFLQRNWPLTDNILNLLLSDMGVAPLQYR